VVLKCLALSTTLILANWTEHQCRHCCGYWQCAVWWSCCDSVWWHSAGNDTTVNGTVSVCRLHKFQTGCAVLTVLYIYTVALCRHQRCVDHEILSLQTLTKDPHPQKYAIMNPLLVCVRKFWSTKDLLSVHGSKKNLQICTRKQSGPQSTHVWSLHIWRS